MAVQRGRRKSVSPYSVGGYSGESDLYLAGVRPGSRQDALRDLNRRGYGEGDSPDPFFSPDDRGGQARQKAQKKKGLWDSLRQEAERDRLGAALCCFLLFAVILLGGFFFRQMKISAKNRADLESYRRRTEALLSANEALREQLSRAQDGERIRNLAMNEHGMLRRERADTVEIYVPAPERAAIASARQTEETRFEMLDFLLGLLDRFHIGT